MGRVWKYRHFFVVYTFVKCQSVSMLNFRRSFKIMSCFTVYLQFAYIDRTLRCLMFRLAASQLKLTNQTATVAGYLIVL